MLEFKRFTAVGLLPLIAVLISALMPTLVFAGKPQVFGGANASDARELFGRPFADCESAANTVDRKIGKPTQLLASETLKVACLAIQISLEKDPNSFPPLSAAYGKEKTRQACEPGAVEKMWDEVAARYRTHIAADSRFDLKQFDRMMAKERAVVLGNRDLGCPEAVTSSSALPLQTKVLAVRLDDRQENLLFDLMTPRTLGAHRFSIAVEICLEIIPARCTARVVDAAKTQSSEMIHVRAVVPIKGSALMLYGPHFFGKSEYYFAGSTLVFDGKDAGVTIPWNLERFGPPVKKK